jgi:hypothetical protein
MMIYNKKARGFDEFTWRFFVLSSSLLSQSSSCDHFVVRIAGRGERFSDEIFVEDI